MSPPGPDFEQGSGGGGSRDALITSLLTRDNHIKWGALGVALTGSTVYAIFIGVVRGVISVGAAIDLFVGGLVGTIERQTTRYFDSFTRQLAAAWTFEIDLGLFQLPFNLVMVLVAFTMLAIGVSQFTDG
ncbi:hypothetical protein [Halorussus sp. MSC15.2]|uniref:hypothetical protein n=1 Tax=Halorussus sp. MSC15.2 TaxID=2283638 RepID=UPI0013D358B4|nr:hypothetical protein [Halorussus sp. MSC15.2]NEU56749.1 hypothetical protein [Halorussus sp. MSC15.2]